MLFSLIFSASLTGLVVFASLKVWKADYTKKEKTKLTCILVTLLTLVLIANEAKSRHYITFSLLGLNEGDCSGSFYVITSEKPPLEFPKLPLVHKHALESIKNHFGSDDKMPEESSLSMFSLLISGDNSGASSVLRYYAESLQVNGIPAFFTRLPWMIRTEQDLQLILQTQVIGKFEQTVGWFNQRKGVTPFIIIDQVHLAFDLESEHFDNYFMKTLMHIFLQHQVKIILHTHDPRVATFFMQTPRMQQLGEVIRYSSISAPQAYDYITQHMKESSSRLSKDQLQAIDNVIGLDYSILSRVTSKLDKTQSDVARFIDMVLAEHKIMIEADEELQLILNSIKDSLGLKDKVTSSNRIIPLDSIKKQGIPNLVSVIIRLESKGILWIDQGYVSFDKRYFNTLFI